MKLLILLNFLTPVALYARSLEWSECVELARQTNPNLNAAKEKLAAADHLWKASYGAFLPTATLNAGLTRSGEADAEASTNKSIGISATQNLFSGLQDSAKWRQARANRQESEWQLQMARAALSADLKTAFASLAYSDELVRLSDIIVKRRLHNFHLVELRFEGGRENKGSLLLSQASVEQARLEKLQAENLRRQNSIALAKVLGLDPIEDLTLKGDLPKEAAPDHPDLKTLIADSPEFRAAIAREEAARAAVGVARSAFLPSLNLSAGLEKSQTDQKAVSDTWNVGLRFSLPLFNGGRDYYTTKASADFLAVTRIENEGLSRDLFLRLEKAYASFKESQQKLIVDQNLKDAIIVRSEIARGQYNNGLVSFGDWDRIENDLVDSERSLLQSRRDRIINEAKWEQLQGKGLIQ